MTGLAPNHVIDRPSLGGGSMRLEIVDPLSYPKWDALVATHPAANIFYTAGWARTLTEAYSFRPRYIVAINGGTLRGLLPLIETRSWLRGARGTSLPFTDECPPLVSSGVTSQALLDAAMQEGTASQWKHLELRGGQEVLKTLPQSALYYAHVLPLASSAECVFKNFQNSVQRAIRKAERSGITVEFSTHESALKEYYALHCRTRTKRGAPPQPYPFFLSLLNNVLSKDRGFIALAKFQGRPIAGAVFLQFAGKAIYKFAASDERHQGFRGANLVIWRSIQRLVFNEVTELNFGRTSLSNDGLRRFKLGWGSNEYFLCYARYCFERRAFVKIGDLAAGFRARAFSMLPVFLSRWIGRAVYAHLT